MTNVTRVATVDRFLQENTGLFKYFRLKSRLELVWDAGWRGKPGLAADITNAAEATRMVADPLFEVQGTNMTSALSTFNAEGGITITTAGANNDQAILAPHTLANLSPWSQFTWGTDREVLWDCLFDTGANVNDAIIWAGLKLTNTPVVATDADQVFVRYEAGVNDGQFQVIYSIGGTDTTVDTIKEVEASTTYHVAVHINDERKAEVFINGKMYAQTPALTDAVDLVPYVGVQAAAAAAKALTVHGEGIRRVRGA